jgi:hypothetical protein
VSRPNVSLASRSLLVALLTLTIAGCGSSAPTSRETGATKSSLSTSTPSSREAAPAIVGRWSNLHSCPALIHAFRAAGLGDLAALQAAAFAPDSPDAQEPSPAQLEARAKRLRAGGDLCAGAHAPFAHSHFFTQSGMFGSIQDGMQDDDGTYRIHGPFLYIGKSKFRYHIIGGDRLTLTPLIPPEQRRRALAHPMDFTNAVWMVAVAYAGSVWKRVPCQEWC